MVVINKLGSQSFTATFLDENQPVSIPLVRKLGTVVTESFRKYFPGQHAQKRGSDALILGGHGLLIQRVEGEAGLPPAP